MDSVKMRGRTKEEAIKAALEVLKLKEEEVSIRIINEGKPGMLGVFGGEEAEVEVTAKSEVGEQAAHYLQTILDKMGITALVKEPKLDGETIKLDIKGEGLGIIIGKEGNILRALQDIVGVIISRKNQQRIRVSIDAGGYKERQKQAIEKMARETAQQVTRSNAEKVLRPMNAADRRVVHMALSSNKFVHTYSRGEGQTRRVVVAPGKPDKSESAEKE